MNDKKYISICVVAGLVLAYGVSGPLRSSDKNAPRVGTPLHSEKEESSSKVSDAVYAQGTVSLASPLEAQAEKAAALFVMGKSPMGGPPFPVKRFEKPIFPLSFSLTTANNMTGEDFYDGDILLVARLDKDGVAGPKQPDDIEARVEIKKGASRAINLTIK